MTRAADVAARPATRLRVRGVVQGVGFRPFVWRLARELGLRGRVCNVGEGVEILVAAADDALDTLMQRLRTEAPPLARIDSITETVTADGGWSDFAIDLSAGGALTTMIGADVAVCPECLAELCDPAGRRWRHAFITCTHCGPRYTVTRRLPYDRTQTSLAPFALCATCSTEYADPADRRFHAETTCCPDCGPQLRLLQVGDGGTAIIDGDPIAQTLNLLRAGAIVAIKGLGGFHLACDARNAEAVARLRARKQRPAKPFAVMALNVASLAEVCDIGDTAIDLLESRERPIVLLDAVASVDQLLPGVAPGLDQLGVMLPLTPIHWLLWHEAAGRPQGSEWADAPSAMLLVMTSANPGGEPLVRDNDEALARLGQIADAILDHNRDIVARCDDSVIALHDTRTELLRRSRGYAPQALSLGEEGATVLALGAHLKTTVCVTRGAEAFLSPHVGDLDTAAGCAFLDETAQRLLDLLAVQPACIAHDAHPDLYSSRLAQQLAAQFDVPTLAVQHHHAHIAAVCAEHQWRDPVLGLALDGIGYGDDGGAWGGELLHVAGARSQRIGHLRPLPLPGGDRAAREPWRMAAAVLHALGRGDEIVGRFDDQPAAATVSTMLERGFNSPPSSSLGRVFDAAAALLGLCAHQRFEAQAAILLEQAAQRHLGRHGWPQPGTAPAAEDTTLDLLPLLVPLIDAPDAERAAAEFHAGLLTTLGAWVAAAAQRSGLNTVALGGGCFANRLLATGLRQNLEQRGLQVLQPMRVPPGDGGLALGQAWVALNTQDN